jgi:ankyrin repeat protein
MTTASDHLAAFIDAACVPLDTGHASGTLERAEAILAAHPEIASSGIHAAAILGDDAGVRLFLKRDPGSATAKGGPRGWDALTHLCFSRYLRLDHSRSEGFVRAATALLDAGASANTGWTEMSHQPTPEWEPALYGAAGIAHHPELTRLLLERGADPNDGEVVYHTPESYDNRALQLLVETGKLTDESLSILLIRKHDWHDYDGIKWLLERNANPNLMSRWGFRALHHALARDNSLEIIALLLDHGADPALHSKGRSAIAMAAREGRNDVLDLFEQRGIPIELHGVDELIAACARNNTKVVRAIGDKHPDLVGELLAEGATLMAAFAGTGNADGVRQLLDLGVNVAVLYEGNGYWGIPRRSMALHIAAWRAHPATVRLLIERGSPVDAKDGNGNTPLALAVRACVDSYWKERRSPESVHALLDAGASVHAVAFPSGYAEVDSLLASHGAVNTPDRA